MSESKPEEKKEQPSESETVVAGERHEEVPASVVQLIERMDEEQILREMKGEFLKNFVYRFEHKGREIVNLSYAGIREAIRRRGHTKILEWRVEDDGKLYKAVVKMHDLVNNIETLGAATCEKDRPFAFRMAINKAERNAWGKMIPTKLWASLIDEFIKRKERKVKPGGPTREELMFAVAPAKEGEDLRFVELADSWEVYPVHYIEPETWRLIHESLKERFGAEYISAGPDTRWVIKKS